MTELDTRSGYRRRDEVLWREAGGYVLVFSAPSASEVLALSGVEAELWRALEHPLTEDQIRRAMGRSDAEGVEQALGALLEMGLLAPARTGAS